MNLLNVNNKVVPVDILEGLRPYALLDFFDFPYLTVDINLTGSYFINYYISGKEDNIDRILVEISYEKLKLFLARDLTLRQCFDTPESDFIYAGTFDRNGNPTSLLIIKSNDFVAINTIPEDYQFDNDVDFDTIEVSNPEILKVKSKQLRRSLIDIFLDAPNLRSSLKYWAIKSFLIPFTEIVRAALLEKSPLFNAHSLDTSVNLGFNRLTTGSLVTTLEITDPVTLFDVSQNETNLKNLFSIFIANQEDELIQSFDLFQNKKIIAEYIKVLNVIVRNDAVLDSKFASPEGAYFEMKLNRERASRLKKIIDEKIPEIEDIEEIQGTLLALSFTKKDPTFAMSASFEDFQVKGHISDELTQQLKGSEKEFVFFLKEYIFRIHTLYTPSSSKSQERTVRTLLGILEIDNPLNAQNET